MHTVPPVPKCPPIGIVTVRWVTRTNTKCHLIGEHLSSGLASTRMNVAPIFTLREVWGTDMVAFRGMGYGTSVKLSNFFYVYMTMCVRVSIF